MSEVMLLAQMAIFFGFFMAWGVGANDVSNAMGTSVGSGALSLTQALVLAGIFEGAGALLASGEVTDTIRSRIIDAHLLSATPEIFVYGMLAALLSSGTWLALATYFRWPVSTTHSIIGSVMGFGLVALGFHAVHWDVVMGIFLSWVITPLMAGMLAYLLFMHIHKMILDTPSPMERAQRFFPLYVFIVTFVISCVTLLNGLHVLHFVPSWWQSAGMSFMISLIAMGVGYLLLRRTVHAQSETHHSLSHVNAHIEKGFSVLTVFTACSLAFAHGSNDVANAIGPLGAVISTLEKGQIALHDPLPYWIPLFGAVSVIIGLATSGHRVITTVGSKITLLTPSRAFAAQMATASTVLIASSLGMPISTTQTLVGAILGVGLAGGLGALNLNVIANIVVSWIITLPAGGMLSIFFFYSIVLLFQ